MLRAGLTDRNQRRALVYSCLRAALRTPSAEAICVAVNTHRLRAESNAIETAVTPLLERVQMNCQDYDSSALVMMDEEQKDDRALREFLRSGSPHLRYDRLIDTLAFMPSEESPGIQVADLIAGSFARHMNQGDPGFLRTFLRFAATRDGQADGYGMKVYHRADSFSLPAARRPGIAWAPLDRAVHEYECAAAGKALTWRSDGTPSHRWAEDWDSPTQ